MPEAPVTISLPMPFGLGAVNAYLLRAGEGFVLIDTGVSGARSRLLRELETAGCGPGALRLVILTHGDFDHTGNAAYLRSAFGVRIAMHRGDANMARDGDMFAGRKPPNAILRALVPRLVGFGKAERFEPDLLLEEGDSLAPHGIDGTVLSVPGHSLGSIAVLTASGDLFCGDLLENTKHPAPGSIVDDPVAARASVARVMGLAVCLVYPGHGRPFAMADLAATGVPRG